MHIIRQGKEMIKLTTEEQGAGNLSVKDIFQWYIDIIETMCRWVFV